jgi:hypothetical protein
MYPYLGWVQQCTSVPVVFPQQHQNRHPGFEYLMNPRLHRIIVRAVDQPVCLEWLEVVPAGLT